MKSLFYFIFGLARSLCYGIKLAILISKYNNWRFYMNLALIGLLTIIVMLALIMSKKLSTLTALIFVPILGYFLASGLNLITGEDITLGKLMIDGLKSIAPTGVMFIFAILFFGILTEAGTFQPIVDKILSIVGKDPAKITVGTVIMAMLVHLDGSGAVTFLIVIPAMLPLYDELGMKRTVLATCAALGAGVMNILPWGGPTLRAITALNSNVQNMFIPLIPSLVAAIIFSITVAVYLGRKEKKRLSLVDSNINSENNININHKNVDTEDNDLKRPKLFVINIILILAVISLMISTILDPAPAFIIATALALVINYPDSKTQKLVVDKHAPSAVMMASMLFAAGAFTGIIKGTGMLDAMAQALVNIIPKGLGNKLPLLTGLTSMPLSFVFDPDSYYYGVLPVLGSAVEAFGVDAVMVGRASIIGQMTTGFPISPLTGSTFLLIGLAGVDLAEHQKSTFIWLFLATIIMLVVALVTGAISI